MKQFSVLMSLYFREKPEYAEECFQSLLQQTIPADEWVIIEDGPLTEELYALLDRYEQQHSGMIKRISLKENRGLGLALREGVPACSHELIARMDTDDIARKDRFEIQLKEFEKNPSLDICGSHITEFDGDIRNVLAERIVPLDHDGIVKYQRTRSAFNHVTVMFKKSAVLKAGNYEDCPYMEDDMLWLRMIESGARCKNIDDSLVYVRTGKEMFARRGGLSYFKMYREGRKKMLELHFISTLDYVKSVLAQLAVALMPGKAREWVFHTFLR